MRLQLRQPSDDALRFIASRRHHLNDVGLALDLTFNDKNDLDAARDFVNWHHVKSHHRGQVRFYKTTRYTGPRKTTNNFVSYADQHCHITGEVYCLHIEWRLKTKRALDRAGIHSVADVLTMDHRQFWLTRLILKTVADAERLGRLIDNKLHNSNRRRRWIQQSANQKFSYNFDLRTGGTLKRVYSTQQIIDNYRPIRIDSCLRTIDASQLLPSVPSPMINEDILHMSPIPLPNQRLVETDHSIGTQQQPSPATVRRTCSANRQLQLRRPAA